MNIHTILSLISLLISLVLGLFVSVKARRKKMSILFLIMCLCLTVINLSYIMISLEPSSDMARAGVRLLSLAGGILIPTFFYFTLMVTGRQDLIKRQYHLLSYSLCFAFMLIEIFSLLYQALLALIAIASLSLLYQGSRLLPTKREKTAARYIFWGTIVAGVYLIVDLLPPYGLRTYHFGHIGFTLYLFILAFIIWKYRLIGIETSFIRKTLLFSLMTGFVMAVFMLSLSLVENKGLTGSLSPAVMASIVVALIFQPFRDGIGSLTDRLFVKRAYQREGLLRGIRQFITTTLDSGLLLDYLANTLKETMGIKEVFILLPEDDGPNYRMATLPGSVDEKGDSILMGNDPIIDLLKRGRNLCDYDLEDDPLLIDSNSSKEFFASSGAVVLCPVVFKERLLAIIGLGEKKNGLAYTTEEIESLEIVSKEVGVALENLRLFEDIKRQFLGVAQALIVAMESKDFNILGHADRVAQWSSQIAAKMELPKKRIFDIKTGASLHDVGKIHIPDQILKKPTELSEQEYNEVRSHPVRGYEIILPMRFPEDVVDGVRYHHERFNGDGYPYRLKGEEIPLAGRIVALANTFDALTSNRPYRGAISKEGALAIIKENSGKWFDPKVVCAFLQVLEEQ